MLLGYELCLSCLDYSNQVFDFGIVHFFLTDRELSYVWSNRHETVYVKSNGALRILVCLELIDNLGKNPQTEQIAIQMGGLVKL